MRSVSALVAFLIAVFLLPAVAGAVNAIPPLTKRVTDLTGSLSEPDRSRLEAGLEQLERTKGAQIAVLLIPTTDGEAIEEYALRAAEAWKIGRAGTDDGIVFVVAKNDRTMRIEVGYGLEGAVPDARARQIMDEVVAPMFRAGDFSGGISKGVEALGTLVRGEPLPEPPEHWNRNASSGSSSGSFGDYALLLLFFTAALGPTLRSAFGTGPGSLVGGGAVGVISSFFLPLWGALIFGLLVGMFILIGADAMMLRPHGRRTYSGYGGFPRGGSWGGGGGGSVFRGGGGRFGGGGATGRW